MKQVKTFTKEDDCNEWLSENDEGMVVFEIMVKPVVTQTYVRCIYVVVYDERKGDLK